MTRSEVVDRVWRELASDLDRQGYELVEVEFGRHGARSILRLFIDRKGGVTLDDCQTVSRLVGPLLDEENVIDGRYVLEVSSPGFDRPIRRPKDFERFVGERIRVAAHEPVQGRKQFAGVLDGFEEGMIRITCDGVAYGIHIENLKRANLDR